MFIRDMGLARIKSSQATLTTCSEGTPNYISPETLLTFKYGPTSDAWAYGLILLEIVTAQRAWGSLLTSMQMTSLFMQKTLPSLLSELPQPFRRICESCLHYDVRSRAKMTQVFE